MEKQGAQLNLASDDDLWDENLVKRERLSENLTRTIVKMTVLGHLKGHRLKCQYNLASMIFTTRLNRVGRIIDFNKDREFVKY